MPDDGSGQSNGGKEAVGKKQDFYEALASIVVRIDFVTKALESEPDLALVAASHGGRK